MTRPVLPTPPATYSPADQREVRRLLATAVAELAAEADVRDARRGEEATSVPTTGTWQRGDIVWHAAPVAGGFVGWVCVAAGTPGTWRTFGAISP